MKYCEEKQDLLPFVKAWPFNLFEAMGDRYDCENIPDLLQTTDLSEALRIMLPGVILLCLQSGSNSNDFFLSQFK